MTPDDLAKRWSYVVFAVMFLIDALMLSRTVHLLRSGPESIPKEAPFLLVFILLLQVLVVWLYQRLMRSVKYYRSLKESYEQELDMARQAMESVGHGLALMDDSRNLVYVNRSLTELLGYKPEAMLGRSPMDFIPAEDHPKAEQAFTLRWQGESGTYPLKLRRADGQLIPVLITGTPRWVQGRIVGNFASITTLPAPEVEKV